MGGEPQAYQARIQESGLALSPLGEKAGVSTLSSLAERAGVSTLSPLGERVDRTGVFTSRCGPSEGVCFRNHCFGPLAPGGWLTAVVVLIALLQALPAAAQQIGQNAPPEAHGKATISVSTQLVVETVVVKDKKGTPIEGLTAKDFTVTENGVPQAISFCEPQELPEAAGAAPATRSEPEDIKIYDKLGRTRISPETPGNIRYRDRRLLALYFDMTAMPPTDQLRALSAAQKFIRTQMTAADRVSILRYSGGAVRRPPGFHR